FGAPLFASYIAHPQANDLHQSLTDAYGNPALGPSIHYWGGVDQLGRDVFVRTLYGARTPLTVAFVSTGLSLVIGIVSGLMGAFAPGEGVRRGGQSDRVRELPHHVPRDPSQPRGADRRGDHAPHPPEHHLRVLALVPGRGDPGFDTVLG